MFAAFVVTLVLLSVGGSVASATRPTGSGKADCEVPKVVELSLGAAEKKVRQAGCRVGAVRRRTSTLLLDNHVLGQKPAAGRIGAGRKVTLVVGKGPTTGALPSLGRLVPQRLPRYIAYDPPGGGIWLIKPDGSDAHELGPALGADPVWSPDATKILYDAPVSAPPNDDGSVVAYSYVMNADGSDQRSIMPSRWGPFGDLCCTGYYDFHWSPDGKQLVFTGGAGEGYSGIAIVDADGSNEHGLVNGFSEEASFAPDGGWIVFSVGTFGVNNPNESYGIYVVEPDAPFFPYQITFGGGVDSPSWSPDGKRIVYGCLLDKQGYKQGYEQAHAICELTRARAGGSVTVWPAGHPARQRILYMNKHEIFLHPTWNATGTKILVTIEKTENGPEQIALMSPSGGRPIETGILVARGTYPDW